MNIDDQLGMRKPPKQLAISTLYPQIMQTDESIMKKLLLTIAILSAATRAFGFTAIAYNPDTGETGQSWNYSTARGAMVRALGRCPGGRIVFSSAGRGWYAIDSWRDSDGGHGIVYHTPVQEAF
jgi:hypothetical protein